MICSPVCWSRWTSSVGSSSSRRRIAVTAFSSSPLDFGSKANAITGAGSSSGGNVIFASLPARTSPARVSFSLATAPMSPGAELVDVLVLLALRERQLADPLLLAVGGVDDLRVRRQHPRVDPEQVEPAGVGVGEWS